MRFLLVSGIVSTIYIFIACFTFLGIIPFPMFLLLVIIPLLFCIMIKVIIECKIYGKANVFRFAKKIETEADRKDIFLKSLQEQINSKVLISRHNPKMILIMNSNGIYLYSFLQEEGMYFEKENQWYLKAGRHEIEVTNPIEELYQEENKIEEYLKIDISFCVVLDTTTYLKRSSKKYPVLNVMNAPFYICKTDLLNRFTDKEIMEFINIVKLQLDYQEIKEMKEDDKKC